MFSAADTVLRLEGFGHNDIPFGSSGGKVGTLHALIITSVMWALPILAFAVCFAAGLWDQRKRNTELQSVTS